VAGRAASERARAELAVCNKLADDSSRSATCGALTDREDAIGGPRAHSASGRREEGGGGGRRGGGKSS
jgi:hypothetical protein